MRLIVTDDYGAMSRAAAQLIADVVKTKPDASMVVAVGNSPPGAFRELAFLQQQGTFSSSRLRPFQLDEYLDIPADDPRSLYGWVKRDFLDVLGMPETQLTRLRGDTSDHEAACQAYDDAVRAAGGFDIAILGLGPNGHLGFNEPPTDAQAPTRTVTLTEASITSNTVYWQERERVPRYAMTCGMTHLLAARHILLLVSGAHKQKILRKTVEGPIGPDVPSSYLQQNNNAMIVTDTAAWPQGKA